MSATAHYKTTNEVLAALIAAVTAVQWSAAPAFGDVRAFDSDDLAGAFTELIASKQRVCFVVPSGESYETQQYGAELTTTRTLEFSLLISDRVEGSRQKALYGIASGANTTPGAFALKDLVLPAVTGQLLANPNGVQIEPVNAFTMTISDAKNKLSSRAAVVLELVAKGGHLTATLGLGPNY